MKSPIVSLFSRLLFLLSCIVANDAAVRGADHGDLASLGLVTHWEANIGGAPLANGPKSFVIWPHTTEKREYVTVRSVNRVIERIQGDEVDLKAIEEAITKGEKLSKSPKIGLEGATNKAKKLVATYKALGRNVEMEPYSQRLVYAVSLTQNGILETTDAETGTMLWRTEAGKSSLPMFGPGVSDDFVAVTNGNVLFVYELETGNLVITRDLAFTPTSSPSVLLGKAIVPSVDGRLVAYDIKSKTTAPSIIRSGIENRLGTTISADRQFLAWPTGVRLVMARMEKVGNDQNSKTSSSIPKLWASASLNEPILSSAVATQKGFLASTVEGTVLHCSTEREGTFLWKSRLAVRVSQSPVVNKELAFVVSDEGFLFALRMSDGTDAWGHQPANVQNIIAIGKRNIYVKDSRNTLLAIDLATGLDAGRTNSVLPLVVPNSISDRLFFVTNRGQVTCLREEDATTPSFSTDITGTVANALPEATKPEVEKPKSADADSNPFGEGASDLPNPFDTTDP